MKVLKGFLLLCAGVIGIAVIGNLTSQRPEPVSPSSNAANTREQPRRDPPDSFRGIKWDSVLPAVRTLRETALKGCTAVVEQKNLNDTRPCTHSHTDGDDLDTFIQRQNVSPIFDVPVSEQMLTWSYKKFWSGAVFIYSYKESDLAKLRAALIDQFGPPNFTYEQAHLTKWNWPAQKLDIMLMVDPVGKRPWGASPTTLARSSISLSFGRTE